MSTKSADLWVTLELSHQGEKELPEDITRSLTCFFPGKDLEVFLPMSSFVRKGNHVIVCVLQGYVFVRAGHPAS